MGVFISSYDDDINKSMVLPKEEKIICLDEPTSALDKKTASRVVKQILKNYITILYDYDTSNLRKVK